MPDINTPQSSDCDTQAGLLDVAAARQRILKLVEPLTARERVDIRAGLGRVLATDIVSSKKIPPHTNSAMDGYAVRAEDMAEDRQLRVAGVALAGAPYTGIVQAGECVRIMTGAVLPKGADSVIMQEHVHATDGMIAITGSHKPGQHVRHAGEDIDIGQTVLSAGRLLMPADIGLLASLGLSEVDVVRRARVAFFSTGDELRSVGETLAPGEIYDSNRYTLHGMLTRLGVELIDLGVVKDARDLVREAMLQAAQRADVVITTGGVSVGEADYVKEVLDELGTVEFWKIAMKPGKPLASGKIGNALFFGLPGNPVSVMATFYQFVQPALRCLMGEREPWTLMLRVPCAETLKKRPGRTDFQRGVLVADADGGLRVYAAGAQDSHILSSMSKANCFIVLPAASADVVPGTLVDVQPFAGLV